MPAARTANPILRATGATSLAPRPDAWRESDLRQEIGHRQIAFAGIVVEAEDTAALRQVGQLLRDCGKRRARRDADQHARSEEHTSELQSLMRISYAVFCLKKKRKI